MQYTLPFNANIAIIIALRYKIILFCGFLHENLYKQSRKDIIITTITCNYVSNSVKYPKLFHSNSHFKYD
jgi:hypothetical protein